MEFVKLELETITKKQFQQLIELENHCGLEPYSPQMIAQCIAGMETIACVTDGEIAGFITTQLSRRYLGGGIYIANVNVGEKYRRQGIGKRLILDACSRYVTDHSKARVFLDVRKDNLAAISLYKKLGFVITDEPSGNGSSDVVMATLLKVLLSACGEGRLTLRVLTDSDMPKMCAIIRDPRVNKTYMLPDLTEASAQKLFLRMLRMSQGDAHYIRGIYLDGQLVGFLNDAQIEGKCIELGWVVDPAFHNRGIATAAVRLAINDLFANGYTSVLAGAFEENPASLRVMEKCGMQKLELTEQIPYRGTTHLCIFYEMRKDAQ